jgi:prevent-host-death family protein
MRMNVVAIRSRLADTLNRVAYQGERVVLERRGKGVAALVSMEDLAALEQMEDEIDVREARKALAEMKRKHLKPIPWEQVKAGLGLHGLGKHSASRNGHRTPSEGD